MHAGAYIICSAISIGAYLDTYKEHSKSLQEKSPTLSNYRNDTILTTWEISLNAVEQRNKRAVELLLMSGFLARDDIWLDLLNNGSEDEQQGMTFTH